MEGEMALTTYEKELLAIVIGVTGDDESRIREGIIKALRGVNEIGPRRYLWKTLEKAAKEKIRRVRRKAEQKAATERPKLVLTG